MKTISTCLPLKFLAVSVFVLMSLFSCQKEVIDISQPNTNETFKANSEISALMSRTATNDGSVDNIIDRANCLEVKLPVTVVVNGIELIIDSREDFDEIEDIFDKYANDIDQLDIQYPITIISGDFTETTINSQAELEALIQSCLGENEPDDDIECIDFQYPISISIFNTSFDVIETKKIHNDHDLYIFLDGLDDNTLASLNFPVTMVLYDGSTVTVNNNQELIRVINEAKDACDEDDDYDYNDDDLNCDVQSIKENLKKCAWEITNYNNANSELSIMFKEDFSFKVQNPNGVTEASGSWNVVKEGEFLFVLLNSNYSDFNGEWKVVECGDHFLELQGGPDEFLKIEQNCPDRSLPAVKDFVTDCKWYMYYLESQGTDLTNEYHDYHFDFKEDGTFIMTTGADADTHEGTWIAEEIASGGIAISISSPTLTDDINDYYLLTELNDHKMILQGEQNHTLKLERVCENPNQAERVKDVMAECTWGVYYFELNGADATSQYQIYFGFNADGTFVAEGNGQNYNGEWEVITLNDGSTVVTIASSNLPPELTDEYVVTFDDENKIHLVDNEQNVLKIMKECM